MDSTTPTAMPAAAEEKTALERLAEGNERPPLWGSIRLLVTVCCFFCTFQLYLVKFATPMAIICMTGTAASANESEYAIEGEFNWTEGQKAAVLSASFFGELLTQIPGGVLSYRLGIKNCMLGGFATLAASTMLMPVAARTAFEFLIAMRVFQGFAMGFTFPVLIQVPVLWATKEEKATLVGFAISGLTIANILNFPVSSALCSTGIDGGWPMVYYVPGMTCVALCIALYFLITHRPEDHAWISQRELEYLQNNRIPQDKTAGAPPLRRMLLDPTSLTLIYAMMCVLWGSYVTLINLPEYINRVFQVGIIQIGYLSGLPFIFSTLVLFFGGKVVDLISSQKWATVAKTRKAATAFGFFSSSIVFCVINQFPTRELQLAALVLAIPLQAVVFVSGPLLDQTDYAGQYGAVLNAIGGVLGQVSGILIPVIVRAVAPEKTPDQWQIVFYITAGVMSLAGALFVVFSKSEPAEWATVNECKKAGADAEKNGGNNNGEGGEDGRSVSTAVSEL